MTLEEKQELIKSATSEEELEKRMAEIKEDEEKEEGPKEEIKEEVQKEEQEEVKEEGAITPEEERSLLKDAENLEQRSLNAQTKPIERKGEFKMEETRNSKEYIEAFANYIKTGEDKEVRSLLTTNASGTVAVPDFVYDIVKTNWEKSDIMSLVKRISVEGNMKINFEYSAGEATAHTEGGDPVSEEELGLGIVTLTPVSIKKWISISDEVNDMRGEAFLRYVYDELTRKIVKKTADRLVGVIASLPTTVNTSAPTSPSANAIAKAPGMGLVAEAIANLSDEAVNPVIIMNKLTWANFKEIQYQGNYAIDPFEGLKTIFNNSLPAYDSASANAVYMVVGDLENGALANYPNGDGVEVKYDDKTLMTSDMIRILGRQYVGAGVIADKHFVNIKKPASV